MRAFFITFFVFAAFSQMGVAQDARPTATWQVQKYDLSVTLPTTDTDRSVISKANITVKNVSATPASTISLRISPSADITAAAVNGATAEFTKREEKVGANGT